MKKVILVDDHPLFRSGTRDFIDTLKHYQVVKEFSTGKEALGFIPAEPPDLLLIDISLPDISGFELLKQAQAINPMIKCIMLTMHEDEQYATRAFELGASGYLVKTDGEVTLSQCITAIERNETFVSNNIKIVQTTNIASPPSTLPSLDQLTRLSSRESSIMLQIAQGNTSKEIAQQFNLSLRTVQNHRANICQKLGIQGSNALLKIAIENEAWLTNNSKAS